MCPLSFTTTILPWYSVYKLAGVGRLLNSLVHGNYSICHRMDRYYTTKCAIITYDILWQNIFRHFKCDIMSQIACTGYVHCLQSFCDEIVFIFCDDLKQVVIKLCLLLRFMSMSKNCRWLYLSMTITTLIIRVFVIECQNCCSDISQGV